MSNPYNQSRWLLQHVRSKCFMTENLTEPHEPGWSDSPAQAVTAIDPELFAARLRQSLTPSLLSHCRLVPVVFCSIDSSFWWQLTADRFEGFKITKLPRRGPKPGQSQESFLRGKHRADKDWDKTREAKFQKLLWESDQKYARRGNRSGMGPA